MRLKRAFAADGRRPAALESPCRSRSRRTRAAPVKKAVVSDQSSINLARDHARRHGNTQRWKFSNVARLRSAFARRTAPSNESISATASCLGSFRMTGRLLLSNANILESSIRIILPNNRCSARSWNYARCSSESALGPNSGLSNRDPESARLEIAALCGDYLCAASIV